MSAVTAQKGPADLVIHPRDRRFARGMSQQRWWNGGDPFATALYNALSYTFPRGEAFFVESVKAFKDGAPPRLSQEIRAFIQQEVMHSREHIAFNKRVEKAGYDNSWMKQDFDKEMGNPDDFPPIVNLAATLAMEHFTAIIAKQLLVNPNHLAGADHESRMLWQWHAIEEIEHKGVAFDTFLHAAQDMSGRERWMLRSIVMLQVTWMFWRMRYRAMINLLGQDSIFGLRAHLGIWRLLLGRPGMLRKIFRPWLSYFKPGFHPWDEDDRYLIKNAEDKA